MYRVETLVGSGTFGQVLAGRGRLEAVLRSEPSKASTAGRSMIIKRTVLGSEDHLQALGELQLRTEEVNGQAACSYLPRTNDADHANASPRDAGPLRMPRKPKTPEAVAWVLGTSAACREWEASAALGYKIDVSAPIDDSNLAAGSVMTSAHIKRDAPGGADTLPFASSDLLPLGEVLPPSVSVRAVDAGLPPIPMVPPFTDCFLARGFVDDAQAEELERRRMGTVSSEAEDQEDISPYVHMIAIGERHGDNLYSFCTRNAARFTDPAFAACITQQILSAMAEMHRLGLRHRDIKSHNMLIEINELGFPVVRLCDLGSVSVSPDADLPGAKESSTPYVTSRFYRAPELLAGATHYTCAVDIWAVACTIGELYMLAASLTNDEAAAAISYCRGNGAAYSKTDRAAVALAQEERRLGLSKEAEDRCVAAGQRQRVAGASRSRAYNASVFPGATNDGSQLLHIINLLGTPTAADIDAMQLLPKCKAGLLNLVHMVIMRARGVPLPPHPPPRTVDEVVADTAAGLLQSHPGASREWARAEARRMLKQSDLYNDECAYASRVVNSYTALLAATAKAATVRTGLLSTAPAFEGGAIDLDRDRVLPLDLAAFLTTKYIPPGIADMLARMLRWNPADRITAAEALALPCMAGPEAVYIPDALAARL